MKLDYIWIQASFVKNTLYDYSFAYFHVIVRDQANTISYIVHGSLPHKNKDLSLNPCINDGDKHINIQMGTLHFLS